MRFFRIDRKPLWGDYGSILIHGMVRENYTSDLPYLLLRTGPFIPPLTLPFTYPERFVVCNDKFRNEILAVLGALESSTLIKKKIPKLNWEEWNLDAPEPDEYPRGGEPENYILKRWHSRTAARQMGDVWRINPPESAESACASDDDDEELVVMVNLSTWDGSHFFGSRNQGFFFVTEKLLGWFQERTGDWLEFHECPKWEPSAIVE